MIEMLNGLINFQADTKKLIISNPIEGKWTVELNRKQGLQLIEELSELMKQLEDSKGCRILGE